MIKVSEKFKELCQNDSDEYTPFLEIRFPENPGIGTITGQNIEQDSMKIEESAWDGDEFRLGGCQGAQFQITLVETMEDASKGITERTFGDSLAGQVIDVIYGFKDSAGSVFEDIALFHGTIQSTTRQANRSYRDVTAYDDFGTKFQTDMSDAYNGAFPNADNYKGDWVISPEFTYNTGDVVHDTSDDQYYKFNFAQIADDSTLTSVCQYIKKFIINQHSPAELASSEGVMIDGEKKTAVNLVIGNEWGERTYTLVFSQIVSSLGNEFTFYGFIQDYNLLKLAIQSAGFTGSYQTSYTTWIGKTMAASNLTCMDCMRQIYELWGVVGYLDRKGNLVSRRLNNQTVQETIEKYEELTYKDHVLIPVDQVSIKDQNGNTFFRPKEEKDYANPYYVKDNFCYYSPYVTEDIDPSNISYSMFDGIKGITYQPLSVSTFGMPWIEAGDRIAVVTEDGNTITTIIQNRTLSGTSSLRDEFTTNGETATFTSDTTSADASSQNADNIRQEVETAIEKSEEASQKAEEASKKTEDMGDHLEDVHKHVNVQEGHTGEGTYSYKIGPDAGNATGKNAFIAGGKGNSASGNYAHAEGEGCYASGACAHAEGADTEARGGASHAEGQGTVIGVSTGPAHAEGYQTKIYPGAENAHTEGEKTEARGKNVHVEGYACKAYTNAEAAHAEGYGTEAAGQAQHVQGKYNVADHAGKYAHIVGGGTSSSERKNIHTLDWSGNAEFGGDVRSDKYSLNEIGDANGGGVLSYEETMEILNGGAET
ncbi:MAG: hypothetical protein NC293_10080 [Roseburia sp.]|nr:hypothetical protein [Roseburia sp.]